MPCIHDDIGNLQPNWEPQDQWTNACACVQVRTPIEPLVGLLRHPTSECQRPDRLEYVDIAHDTPLDQVPESGESGICTQMAGLCP